MLFVQFRQDFSSIETEYLIHLCGAYHEGQLSNPVMSEMPTLTYGFGIYDGISIKVVRTELQVVRLKVRFYVEDDDKPP